MANKAETKEVSKGICNFCKGEFEKAKMTQHLKYCKQRGAETAEEEEEEEFNVDELLETFPPESLNMLPKNFLSELKKFESIDDLVTYLKEKLNSMPKRGVPHSQEEWNEYRARYFQAQILEALLEMVEDRSLDALLEKVLKVGQKFSYEYDFGSSTDLTLKVLSEREGG